MTIFLVTLISLVSFYLIIRAFKNPKNSDLGFVQKDDENYSENLIMKGELIPEATPEKTPKKKAVKKSPTKKKSKEVKEKEVKPKAKRTQKKSNKSKKDKGGDEGSDLLLS